MLQAALILITLGSGIALERYPRAVLATILLESLLGIFIIFQFGVMGVDLFSASVWSHLSGWQLLSYLVTFGLPVLFFCSFILLWPLRRDSEHSRNAA